MKNSFKKLAVLTAGLMTSMGSFAISTGGAVAAGAATAVGLGLVIHGVKKSQNKDVKSEKKMSKKNNKQTSKKDLKKQLNTNKKDLKKHKTEVKKLQRKNASPEKIAKHESIIARLEDDIKDVEMKIESIL